MRSLILYIIIAFAIVSCHSNKEEPAVTATELFGHLSYLASDSLKGRLPGTAEDELAARYIAGEFMKAGLEWLTQDGLQSFEVITDLALGTDNHFSTEDFNGTPGEDFAPFPFTGNTSLETGVVFAGYGFDIDESGLVWNDYMGIDVTGKWVMVLRGNVEIDSSASPFHAYSSARDKAMTASDNGAAGILFVSGPVFSSEDELVDLENREGKVPIPAIHIKRTVADLLLSSSGKTISSLEEQMIARRQPSSFETYSRVNASAEVIPAMQTTYNVIGFLEGNDPDRRNRVIILGAHYDHLGMGGKGSSSRNPDTLAAHNGADDNASGVAALIEIAEKISNSGDGPAHSFIFIAFGAEEIGLLGSKYYVENALIPIDSTVLMLNMDMVGRMDNGVLMVGGIGTAGEFRALVERFMGIDSLKLELMEEGYGASDHSNFYSHSLPVLFVTTGGHLDYHTPEDDVEKLNIEGMVKISSFVENVLASLDSMLAPLTFQESGPTHQYSPRRKRRIELGIMPDFMDSDDKAGMRADLVFPGQPAHLGGMKKGDLITAIEGMPVNNIYDYMFRLSKVKKGQVIILTVKRGEQEIDLLVQL